MRRKLTIEERMIRDLLRQKRRYERYFKTLQGVDNQAQTAYTNIIKVVVGLSKKTREEAVDPEEMRRIAEEIMETEYGIKR